MSKILVTEFMDEGARAAIREYADIEYDPDLHENPTILVDKIAAVECLIIGDHTKVTADVLAAAPDLKCIGRLGVSTENIDTAMCKKAKVSVLLASGGNAVSVAEYVMTTALMLLRNAYFATEQIIGGTWPRNELIGREARGRKLGLIGFGYIGQAVAKRANAFEMQVIAHDPLIMPESPVWGVAKRRSIDEIIEECDVISLHTQLTDDTKKLLGKDEFRRMKPGAVLINSASGQLIDEIALVDALRSRHLGGAALDVFENEPLNEVQGKRFIGLNNVILSPHVAGATHDSHKELGMKIAHNVLRALGLTKAAT